nr:uncharacterized protein LOC104117024 isoform X3 [Nicotiana tomentosiformis]
MLGIFKTRSTGKPLQLLAQVSSRQEVQASHYSCWLRYLQDKKYRQATTAAGSGIFKTRSTCKPLQLLAQVSDLNFTLIFAFCWFAWLAMAIASLLVVFHKLLF